MTLSVYKQSVTPSVDTDKLHKIESTIASEKSEMHDMRSAGSKKSKSKKVGFGFIIAAYMDVQKYIFREHVDAFKARHSRALSRLRIV